MIMSAVIFFSIILMPIAYITIADHLHAKNRGYKISYSFKTKIRTPRELVFHKRVVPVPEKHSLKVVGKRG
jgi:predicted RNA methylase